MNKRDLVKQLRELQSAHPIITMEDYEDLELRKFQAEGLLLKYINNEEVRQEYNKIRNVVL